MNAPADEIQSLRRCVRDLVAFTALPAVWTGREPLGITESLADILLRTLSLDLVYVYVQGSPNEVALEAARAAGQPDVASRARAVGRALAPWLRVVSSSSPSLITNPLGNGTVRLTVTRIGYEGE